MGGMLKGWILLGGVEGRRKGCPGVESTDAFDTLIL